MDQPFRRVMSCARVAAGLLLAVAYVLPPAEARAGCTHPWVTPAGESSSVGRLSILEGPLAPDDGLPSRLPDRSPCANGACSPAPVTPILPGDRVPQLQDHWGALTITSPAAIRSSLIRRAPGEIVHSRLHTDRLVRPPR
jgi:hypothetical protein